MTHPSMIDKPTGLVTLEEAVKSVIDRHGGVRAASRATGVDRSFISRLMSGKKVSPSDETLNALGLRAVPLYEILNEAPCPLGSAIKGD